MHAPASKTGSQADTAQTNAAEAKTANVVNESPQQIPLWADGVAPAVQFSLKVNTPGDKYEREADRVADTVMRMPDAAVQRQEEEEEEEPANDQVMSIPEPAVQRSETGRTDDDCCPDLETPVPGPAVQRQEEEEEEELETEQQVMRMLAPLVQRKEIEEEAIAKLTGPAVDPKLLSLPQAKLQTGLDIEDRDELPFDPAWPGQRPMTGADLRHRLDSLPGSGRPILQNERAFYESRFGRDFSGVRIHTGSEAVRMAHSLQARAFTLGNNIVFNRGQYAPGNTKGRHLMAHELTHVVQQGHGPRSNGTGRQPHSRGNYGATSLVQRRQLVQRVPDESRKYPIDYKKAGKDNLASWYSQYKFFNLFREEKIYPGSQPIAYANRVFELQEKLIAWADSLLPDDAPDEMLWSPKELGILEPVMKADSTMVKLLAVAISYHNDPSADYGFNTTMLERIHKYYQAYESAAPPLVSAHFKGIPQLEAVNRNRYFYIKYDDRGEYVGRIQLALLALNYDLGDDAKEDKESGNKVPRAVFGKGTKKAVVNFQRDSGFEGKDVDGIVGQKTLRLLDQRIGAPAFRAPSVAGGDAFVVQVPVTAADLLKDKTVLKKEMLLRALRVAFPITAEQADILSRSGWNWVYFLDLTQAAVDRGHIRILIPIAAYESVVGEIKKASGKKPDEPIEPKIKGLTLDLLKTGKLVELNEKIDQLEDDIRAMKNVPMDLETKRRDIDWDSVHGKEAELARLKKDRQLELNRLGITLDEFKKLKTDFIETFERFAAIYAFRMLAENELQANIESQHYANIEEVKAIKVILGKLAAKYEASEKFWWEAVSLEEGKPKSYYTSSSDYETKNTVEYYEDKIKYKDFIGTSSHFYTEKNVAAKYESLQKKPSTNFADWKKTEEEVVSTLQESVDKFPILAYPKLQLRYNARKLSAKSDESLQKKLLDIVNGTSDDKGIKQNIQATREELAKDTRKIWELPVVVLKAQYALGLIDGVPVELIKAKQKAVANKGFWESIGLAILGIGLGLLALVSGPVGWLALAGSIGVGAYDAYRTYEDITFKKETAGTAIDPAKALGTEDPSYFWFWVSLISVGLDVAQAAKLVKSVAKGMELAEGVTKGLNEARAAAQLKLAEVGETSAKGKALLKEIDEIDNALTKVKSTEFAKNHALLEPLKENPMAVIVMSEALSDKKIVRAVTDLGKLLDKDMFAGAIKFYASVGRSSLDELPELLRLAKEGGRSLTTNKRLMAELLSDPRAQRALLDTQDPKLFAKEFEVWEAAVEGGKSESFVKYLEGKGLSTKLSSETRLVDMFGEAFTTLPNKVKNTQIMRTIEPRLLDAFNAGSLSPEISKGLEVVLNSEVLAKSTRLASAQQRMLRELRILGGLIETQSEFSKVMALLNNPASRKALWEGAINLAGKEKYVAVIMKANGGKIPAADVLDDLIRIGPMTDEDTVRSLLSGPGAKLRRALAANPEAVAVLKKCASPCLPSFATPEQVNKVAEIMKGKSSDDILRIREYLYANRGSEDSFKAALASMESDFAAALKDVALPVLSKPKRLKVADETLRAIVDLGLPVSALNKIMAKTAAVSGGADIVYDLFRVLQFEKSVPLKHFDTLITALSEGSKVEFRAARHLVDEAGRFIGGSKTFKYNALQSADVLLGKFSLTQLNSMMGARWSGSFVNTLYDVAAKMPGVPESKIVELITNAGGGRAPGNLGRLHEILSTMKKPAVTFDEANEAIKAADAFAVDLAKAMRDPETGFEAMAKLIWGPTVKVETVEVAGKVKTVIKVTEVIGENGSDLLQQVSKMGRADEIAKTIAKGAEISPENWKVFRKVIDDADIADPIIKSKIIGDMWERVNVRYYEAIYGRGNVFTQVTISNGTATAVADIVVIKGDRLIVVECKAGGAVYERGQKIIYPLLEQGKFDNVMLVGDEDLAQRFARAKKKSFKLERENEVIPPG